MKIIKLSIILFATTFHMFSQEDVMLEKNMNFSLKAQYLFNTFIDGDINFNDGSSKKFALNYNVIIDEIHYIDNKILKTFSKNDIVKINSISIGAYNFIIDNFKIYEIIYNNKILILKRRIPNIKDENTGAYGTTSNTSSQSKITNLSLAIGSELERSASVNITDKNLNYKKIKVQELLRFKYKNQIYSATKRSLLKIYPNSNKEIKSYIKKNNPDFKNRDDLVELIKFCTSLLNPNN